MYNFCFCTNQCTQCGQCCQNPCPHRGQAGHATITTVGTTIPITKRCVKCLSTEVSGPAWTGDSGHIPLFDKDKLRYTCLRCNYTWLEKCADKAAT